MASQVILHPTSAGTQPSLDLLTVAPLAVSALVVFVFFISYSIYNRQIRETKRKYSLLHVGINTLVVVAVGICVVLNAYITVKGPLKLRSACCATVWVSMNPVFQQLNLTVITGSSSTAQTVIFRLI